MQDELKKVISKAMNTKSEFEQEPIAQFAEGELSDEALETVAGGMVCFPWRTVDIPSCIKLQTRIYLKAEI
ncbi:MAG: hypothetical protein KME46_28100 [Brasilonema angustatum HA4187-MV1]|jgi:hypothetical protein|nr:hypothetical protein [Brasilonema angustatum HA4187-MV1]